MTTERRCDIVQENLIGTFLHKYLYTRLSDKAELVKDKERQTKGIDEVCLGMLIDNKAQSSPAYIGNPAPTFILELLFKNKLFEETTGWFLDPDLFTTHYAFVWVNSAYVDHRGRIVDLDDIDELEVMIVNKDKLKKAITNDFSVEYLYKTAREMWDNGASKHYFGGVHNYSMTCTHRLDECPVTLVTKKGFLKRFSTHHYLVHKENIISLT